METPLGRRQRAPLSFGAVVDGAFESYVARAPLYLAVALTGLLIQWIAALLSHENDNVMLVANLAIDAFLAAVVTIGAAAYVRDRNAGTREILATASLRFVPVLVVSLVAWFLQDAVAAPVFNPVDTSPLGLVSLLFLVLPLLALSGPLSCATVVAALLKDMSPGSTLLKPLFEPFLLGWSHGNVGRMVLLGIASLPVPMLASVLQHQFTVHAVPYAAFLSTIPLDALAAGPYQALYTVFFLDLRDRTDLSRRSR